MSENESITYTPEQQEQIRVARERLMKSAGIRDFAPLILEYMKPGVAIHTDRAAGKTEALLVAVRERCDGRAVVVARTTDMVEALRNRYRKKFWTSMNSDMPFFKTAEAAISFLPGRKLPIYCDEWWSFSKTAQEALAKSGLVAGAVGTIPGLAGCIEPFPLLGPKESEDEWIL